jgi:hypothetical protein
MAHIYADKITEALACCCLSQLYYQLRDDEKGSFYPMKAESLLARYGEQWDSKNKCTIMLSMANAERKVISWSTDAHLYLVRCVHKK